MENHSLSYPKEVTSKEKILLLTAIIFVSFNLRPAITAVGPLIGSIRDDFGLSNGLAGLITTLPLLSFALLSFIAPKLGYRFGNETMILVGLLTLITGIMIRSTGVTFLLFTGTALVGVGIALANVLLPSIIKSRYPENIGLITGIYTTAMCIFAAIGSGLSIPLSEGLHLGWQKSLLAWTIIAFIGLFLWYQQFHRDFYSNSLQNSTLPKTTIWKSKIAWQVTLFMGLQSFLFYCLITWLPEILHDKGLTISQAGWMVAMLQVAGLPVTFLTPILADRFRNQRTIVVVIGILYLSGLTGIIVSSHSFALTISSILLGLGQGASISLALTFIGLRTTNPRQAAELSGMAQSIGYLLAASGPILLGVILDFTHSGTAPLILLTIVSVIMVMMGLGAGKNETIDHDRL
ncbi:CynX/NimT family MFS transporter [Halalkalibacter krulwichiae]|uniref:Putative transporter YycB n=1 Tax=Halalkalibacter krulwichiae TaxID=199441 RepID=A0A1X9MHI8_9BACI|nr:MFS transporter [Halalkalibacter krulwichiae]ARK29902.1 putative transporter YycB [Halalkalibacter krulwichiae]